MYTNRQAVQGFFWGGRYDSKNIFYKGISGARVLYSYGLHYPLAVIINGISDIFLNSDKYSQTTSCHYGLVKRQAIKEGYTITEKTTEELQAIIKNRI